MACEIERRRPGTLPKKLERLDDREHLFLIDHDGTFVSLPTNLSHATLRDVMVMAIATRTGECSCSDVGWHGIEVAWPRFSSFDAEYDGCPTRSLFAAFCEIFPVPTST